jgi:peptidoglycan DL-endopeptidase CwlO
VDGESFSGSAIGAIAAGGLLVFAGIKGYSLATTLQDVVQGKNPLDQTQTAAITGTTAAQAAASLSSATAPSTTGSAIANAALKYQGHCYLYGGAPGISGTGCWDCSSFVNWVVGHDLGLAIPGYAAGTYNGTVHGPATGSWMLFGNAVSASDAVAGDIVVGPTHMGIVTGPGEYVSAHDPAEGTSVASISGFPDPVKFYRRLATG